jgi:hypothetical protein
MAPDEINEFNQILPMPTAVQEKITHKRDVAVICRYLERDEKRHYEESGRPRDHIWCCIRSLKRWLRNSNNRYLPPLSSKK